MNQQSNNPEISEVSDLEKIRSKQQISIESVADDIKVSRDFIRYIESGQFEKLGAPTFLRGHITNYSKALGIDPHQVLSLIPGQFLQHHELKTADGMATSPLAKVRRQSNHFGRYAVGTALLGMLTLSFYFIWDKWSVPKQATTDTPIDLALENNDSDTDKKITYSSLLPQVAGPQPQQDNTVSSAVEEDTTPDNADSNEEVVEEPDAESEDDNNGGLQQANITAAVEPIGNLGDAKFVIKMDLEEEAWVSIKTLDGDKIVHDLIGPGLREYQSDEPMHFRIGNAKKLQLMINETPVELGGMIRRDIADFEWPKNPS